MSEPTPARDFTFSVVEDKLGKIRDTEVPAGTVAAPGVGYVSPEGRGVTQRALAMIEGLFHFAEQSHRKEPTRSQPEAQ